MSEIYNSCISKTANDTKRTCIYKKKGISDTYTFIIAFYIVLCVHVSQLHTQFEASIEK